MGIREENANCFPKQEVATAGARCAVVHERRQPLILPMRIIGRKESVVKEGGAANASRLPMERKNGRRRIKRGKLDFPSKSL